MASDTTAKFSIDLETNASDVAGDASESLLKMQREAQESAEALKRYSASLRSLRGSSEDVKAVKEALSGKIAALRNKVSEANVAFVKQGTTYEAVAGKARKIAAEQEKLKASANAISGNPITGLSEKFTKLRNIVSGGQGGQLLAGFAGRAAVGAVAAASAAIAAGIAVIAASVVAAGVAIVAGTVALSKFIVTTVDAARSMGLMREAAYGNAKDAAALGTQVERLARKLPQTREELNALSVDLSKAGFGGQTLVDALEAIAGANAALGNDVGAKFKGILEAGRMSGRVAINPLELMGTGLNFDDVAGALAKSMKVGIADARKALVEGRVSLADGAAAMKGAIDQRFGSVFDKMSLALPKLKKDFEESLGRLTKGVNIEPILQGLRQLVDMFDTTSVTGQALNSMIKAFASILGAAATNGTPLIKNLFEQVVIFALRGTIALLEFRKWLTTAFDGKLKSEAFKNALLVGEALLVGMAAAAGLVVIAIGALAVAAAVAVSPFVILYTSIKQVYKFIADTDWSGLAGQIIGGLVGGLERGGARVVDAIKGLAGNVKRAFTGEMEIKSPSKLFERYGAYTAEGFERGVEEGTPGATQAIRSLGGGAPSGAGASSAGPVKLEVNFNIGGGATEATVHAMQSPAFINQLTRAIEGVLVQGGLMPAT